MSKTYKNGGYNKVTFDSTVGRDPNSKDKEAGTFSYYVRINRQSWADLGLIKLEFETKTILGKKSKTMKKLPENAEFFKDKHKAWKDSIDKVNAEIKSVVDANEGSKRKLDCKVDTKTGEVVSWVLRNANRKLDLPKSYGSSKTTTKAKVNVKPAKNTSKEAMNLAAFSEQDIKATMQVLSQLVNA